MNSGCAAALDGQGIPVSWKSTRRTGYPARRLDPLWFCTGFWRLYKNGVDPQNRLILLDAPDMQKVKAAVVLENSMKHASSCASDEEDKHRHAHAPTWKHARILAK